MITKNFETSQRVLTGYLFILFTGAVIGYLLYRPFGPMALIAGIDLGFLSGIILAVSLLINTMLGILMKYTDINISYDLHVVLGSFVFAFAVLHAFYNYSVLYG